MRLASRLLHACVVLLVSACAAPGLRERPEPTEQQEFRVPPEGVPPLGQCRIWYSDLPAQWQPPAMSCSRANELARQHGGRVIKAISPASMRDGRTLALDYGPSEFGGLAPEQLPPPGYCRPWYERTPADRQPAPMTCERARELVQRHGGRVLYMPGPEQP
ncbi:MAG TPA: hypothetical protein VFV84_11400 [Burkholderiales bacterium]|nr:hypothetical protein [Burkholderiales bacterium]